MPSPKTVSSCPPRILIALTAVLATGVLTACSSDRILEPTPDRSGGDRLLGWVQPGPVQGATRGSPEIRVAAMYTPEETVGALDQSVIWLYTNGYLDYDQAFSLVQPLVDANGSLGTGDYLSAIGSFESFMALTQGLVDSGVLTAQAGTYLTDLAHVGAGRLHCLLQTDIATTECDALVAVYSSTNGASWTNATGWLDTSAPCAWYGVTCDAGGVSVLRLAGNGLTGSIPGDLGNLSNLTVLDLGANQLTGSIPAELGSLSKLFQLGLYDNQLTGSIPAEIGNLSNLEWLYLRINQLSGPIPAELGNLPKLERLVLNNNQLSGSIPPELGNLASLRKLTLNANQLTGGIPAELGSLANLETLWLQNNHLSHGIPLAVAQRGGVIQSSNELVACVFPPQSGNGSLGMPDTPSYRDADLDGDGYICGVKLYTPEEVVGLLQDAVTWLQTNGYLNPHQAQSLQAPLDDASQWLAEGDSQQATDSFQSFLGLTQGLVDSGVLTTPLGQYLIGLAQVAVEALAGA